MSTAADAAAGTAREVAAQWWDKLLAGFERGAPLDPAPLVLVLILAGAVAVSVPRAGWRWFGLFVTVVHELGHAFAALMTGQVVKGIHLRFDHSGAMHSLARGSGAAGAAWAGFWGYPAPAVTGAALVWAAYAGWSGLALSVSALLLLATLLFIRNWQGAVIAVSCAAAAVLLVWYATPVFLGYFTLAVGVALLVGAVRDWFKVLGVHTRRRHALANSDAYILSRRTGVPAGIWLGGFAAVITASCLAGAGAVAGSFS
ncbi:M50 family metallopeptidase [Arthrobacter mobilis]|uniref:M50 family metallopeptidase n=1 Tax=Arthrobacter mobilis TaxID=2724944 RepID=A0A7X6H9K3_9MICC|nr:M50 family metallopeptidase [Arthrobacter mobilis]NKX52984.1 M50 family metallopeptidase [Arthrobacter mobilis]